MAYGLVLIYNRLLVLGIGSVQRVLTGAYVVGSAAAIEKELCLLQQVGITRLAIERNQPIFCPSCCEM